jgi:ABC-type phosphate transport system substrate-binding protein
MNIHINLATTLLTAAMAFAGDYVVIANPATAVSDIGKAELKRIFTGKVTQFDGKKATPINLPDDNAAKADFLKEVVGESVADYKQYWVEQKVKGNGVPPMQQASSAAVKAMVAAIPGSVAYIPKADADASVKVVAVK